MRLYGAPPWGEAKTPHLDALAAESLVFEPAYPESLPTLPTRRAIYTGRRVYPFHNGDFRLKGDFVGAPGWGPIPEDQDTLAELLRARPRHNRVGERGDRGHRQVVHELQGGRHGAGVCRGRSYERSLHSVSGDLQVTCPSFILKMNVS